MNTDGWPNTNQVWRCPYCKRATPTSYRCQNYGCKKDLTDEDLEEL